MIRHDLIEQIRRQIYGGQATDDASITEDLVNQYIEQGIAIAAKQNYKENAAIEAVAYVNNSFYSTFKGIAITKDETFVWKIQLPQIPIGIGRNEGVSTLQFKNDKGLLGLPVIWLSENEKTFYENMRPIPNSILAYPEGGFVYTISTIMLSAYTANVTMVSGGDATDLTSTLNVPSDYIPVIVQYVFQQLNIERNQPQDTAEDGSDNK